MLQNNPPDWLIGSWLVHAQRGWAYDMRVEQGDQDYWQEALQDYEAVWEAYQHELFFDGALVGEVLVRAGQIHEIQGQSEQAIEKYQAVLEVNGVVDQTRQTAEERLRVLIPE